MHVESALRKERPKGSPGNIPSALGLGEVTLRELDFEDVMLSRELFHTLGSMSGRILARYIPNPRDIAECIDEFLDLLTERAFWVEQTGDLVICVSIGEDNHYIQVPPLHWRMRHQASIH